jgi:2,3-dihydroxy-p-cumate/2,3-dihydroxybenzoate 3,4-dioxygenase
VRRWCSGRRYFASRDAGINRLQPHRPEFNRSGRATNGSGPQVSNARVSDRIGDIPLMRVSAIHHTIALVRGAIAKFW